MLGTSQALTPVQWTHRIRMAPAFGAHHGRPERRRAFLLQSSRRRLVGCIIVTWAAAALHREGCARAGRTCHDAHLELLPAGVVLVAQDCGRSTGRLLLAAVLRLLGAAEAAALRCAAAGSVAAAAVCDVQLSRHRPLAAGAAHCSPTISVLNSKMLPMHVCAEHEPLPMRFAVQGCRDAGQGWTAGLARHGTVSVSNRTSDFEQPQIVFGYYYARHP